MVVAWGVGDSVAPAGVGWLRDAGKQNVWVVGEVLRLDVGGVAGADAGGAGAVVAEGVGRGGERV